MWLLGRGGAGPTVPRPEVTALGAAGGAYEAGPITVQGAIGVEARIAGSFRLISEYKYTFTPTSFDIPSGRAAFHAHSHHGVVGIGYYFRNRSALQDR